MSTNDPKLVLSGRRADGTTFTRSYDDLLSVPTEHMGVAALIIGRLGEKFDSLRQDDPAMLEEVRHVTEAIERIEESFIQACRTSVDSLTPVAETTPRSQAMWRTQRVLRQVTDGEVSAAIQELKDILALDVNCPAALSVFAVCCIRRGRFIEMRWCMDGILHNADTDTSVSWRSVIEHIAEIYYALAGGRA